MPEPALRLIVLARDQGQQVQDAWEELSGFLNAQPNTEVVAAAVNEDLKLDDLDADLVVVLGGDGAMLRACRQLGMRQLPILGINLGRLGFLADLTVKEFRTLFPRLHARDYRVIDHLMFECIHHRADGGSQLHLGLNDVVVSTASSLAMINVKLTIDGEDVTTYSCDGLIVSTPVGSTAHSLSAGGPILQQDLQAFVITPICPHTLTNRPLVDRANCVYTLTVPDAPEGVMVVIDGQVKEPMAPDDAIEVRKAPVSLRLVRFSGHSNYTTLHRKLGWGGQPRYRTQ